MLGFGKSPQGDEAFRTASAIASMLEAYAAREGVAKLLDPTCRVVLLDDGKIALCFGPDLLRGAIASATTADKKDLQGFAAVIRNSPDPATTEAIFESMAPMTFDLVAREVLGRLQRGGHDPVIQPSPKRRDYEADLVALAAAYDCGDMESVRYYKERASIVGERALRLAFEHGFDEANARVAVSYDDGDLDFPDYMSSVRALIIGEIASLINEAATEQGGGHGRG